MNRLSAFGLLFGLAAIVIGFAAENGSITVLLEPAAFLIVIGGTAGAVMVQSTHEQLLGCVKYFSSVFHSPVYDLNKVSNEVLLWATEARQHGFLALEPIAVGHDVSFVRNAVSLLVDGNEPDAIKDLMTQEDEYELNKWLNASDVYQAAGGYAPTIGIIGAVLGLIQAMSHIKDPEMLGAGIASAFVATIYGVAFANLLFIPIANKMAALAEQESMVRKVYLDGVLSIARGASPREIEIRLTSFTHKSAIRED